MLNSITIPEMEGLIKTDHPNWAQDAIHNLAQEYINFMDSRLEKPLRTYLDTQKMTDFAHGEFTLLLIRAMKGNCSYLTAVSLMDAYLKDSLNGKALILRR